MPIVNPSRIAELYLAAGNTALTDSLDLTGFAQTFNTRAYTALRGSFPVMGSATLQGLSFQRVASGRSSTSGDATENMLVTIPLGMTDGAGATSGDSAIASEQAIYTKLRQAAQGAGAYGLATSVFLWLRLIGSSHYTYFAVTSGAYRPLVPNLPPTSKLRVGILTLTCPPWAQGDPITDPVSAVLTASSPSIYRSGIPGDAEALTRLWIADLSANSAIAQGFTLTSRSLDGMGSTDFTPTYAVSPAGSGVSNSDSSALGSTTARLSPVPSTFATLGQFASGAGAAQQGEFDVLLRVRDSATVIGSPGTLSAGPSSGTTNELLFGGGATYVTGAAATDSVGAGWTALTALTRSVAGTGHTLAPIYQAISATGTYAANGTWSATNGKWAAGAVSYKAPSATPAPVGTVGTATSTSTSLANLSVTVGAGGVAKGDTVILALDWLVLGAGVTFSASDTQGNIYTADLVSYDGLSQYYVQLSAPITTALVNTNTITVTASHVSGAGGALGAYEFSGISTAADRIDHAVPGQGTTLAWTSSSLSTATGSLPPGNYSYALVPTVGTASGPSAAASASLAGPFAGVNVLFTEDFENEGTAGTVQWQALGGTVFNSAAKFTGTTGANIPAGGTLARPTPPQPASKQLYLQFDVKPNCAAAGANMSIQLGTFTLTFTYNAGSVNIGYSCHSVTGTFGTVTNNTWIQLGILWDGTGPTGRFLSTVLSGSVTWANWIDDGEGTATYPDLLLCTAGTSTNAMFVDNVIGADANPQSVTPSSIGSALNLTWTSAANATAYQLYYRFTPNTGVTQPWSRVTLGNVTSYTHTSLFPTGVVLASPPSGTPSILPTQVRLLYGTASGQMVNGPAVACRISNGEWEWLPAGDYPLPPEEVPEGMVAFPWLVKVQAENLSTDGSSKTFDCDMAVLIARDGDSVTLLASTPLASPGLWMVDTRRDNRVSAAIYGTGTVTATGNVVTDATRTAATFDDGITQPGGYGIYPSGTVLTHGTVGTAGRVTMPSSLLTATTGFVDLVYTPKSTTSGARLFSWSSGSAAEIIECFWTGTGFTLARQHTSSGASLTVTQAISIGTAIRVTPSWTATQLSLSINGGAATIGANSSIPTSLGATFDVGSRQSIATGSELFGSVQAVTTGTGTPAAADLTALAALSALAAPTPDLWSAAAAMTARWTCRQGTYGTSTLLGHADTVGQLTLGPANTLLTIIPEYQDASGNLISDVADWNLTVQPQFRPRFGLLRGAV